MTVWDLKCIDCNNRVETTRTIKNRKLMPKKKVTINYCKINDHIITNSRKFQKWCPLDDTEEIMTMSEQIFNRGGYTS